MTYDAISKDPREVLRMLGSNSSFIGQSLDEFITTLHKSTHTGPFNPRHVKMNEFKSKTIQYCNHFQEGKCRFGEKCRYEHKINPIIKRKKQNMMRRRNLIILFQIKIIINFNIRKKFLLNKIIIIIIIMAIKMMTQKENLLNIQINVKFPFGI